MDFVYVGDNANTRYHLYPLRTDVVGGKPVQFAHVLHTKKRTLSGRGRAQVRLRAVPHVVQKSTRGDLKLANVANLLEKIPRDLPRQSLIVLSCKLFVGHVPATT